MLRIFSSKAMERVREITGLSKELSLVFLNIIQSTIFHRGIPTTRLLCSELGMEKEKLAHRISQITDTIWENETAREWLTGRFFYKKPTFTELLYAYTVELCKFLDEYSLEEETFTRVFLSICIPPQAIKSRRQFQGYMLLFEYVSDSLRSTNNSANLKAFLSTKMDYISLSREVGKAESFLKLIWEKNDHIGSSSILTFPDVENAAELISKEASDFYRATLFG